MKTLLTLNADSTVHRVSDDWHALEHPWFAKIAAAPSVKYATRKLYGGFTSPTFGGFTLIPGFTKERKMSARLQFSLSDEANAVTLLEGTAIRSSGLADSGDSYDFRKTAYNGSFSGLVSGNLQTVFSTFCGASYLDRTLDVSGTSRDPAVSYTLSSDTPVIDILSSITEFFTHGFHDDGTTIYLFDMLADNGSLTLSEYEFQPPNYEYATPYSRFVAGDYSVDGTDTEANADFNVSPVCHTNQTLIEASLNNIKTLMEMDGATLSMPLTEKTAGIKPGMKLSWVDNRAPVQVTAWIRVQSINYDLESNPPTLVVTGKGSVT